MTKVRNRQQLIDAAAKVFREKGYEAARLEDIAAELGMLQGSLYYHVGSKAGLLRLVLRQRFERIACRLEAIAEDETRFTADKLRCAIEEQIQYIERYLPDMPQWFNNPSDPQLSAEEADEDHAMLSRYRAAWERILREGMESGTIKSTVDPAVAVLSIVGMCNYVARWHEWYEERDRAQLARLQFDMLWAGLAESQTTVPPIVDETHSTDPFSNIS